MNILAHIYPKSQIKKVFNLIIVNIDFQIDLNNISPI